MQNDRININFGKQLKYRVHGYHVDEAISQVCQENEVFFLTGSKIPV